MHSEKVSTATSTSSNESRKSSKPIMEKRRRARMNASLTELKSLLLEVMKKDGNRHSKMEKADILEMTVKHLRHLQRQHFTVPTTKEESPFLTKYSLGFQECTSEVSRYLSSVAEVDTDIRTRLLNHLATYVSQPSTPSAVSSTASSPTSTTSSSAAVAISSPISRPPSVTDISAVHSPAASVTSPPSPSTTQRLTPLPSAPPSHIQLQLAPSLAQSPTSVQSSQISMSTAETTTGPESMVAPKQITIFPADFCTATTTTTTTAAATESTFSAPASGGILSLDTTSCPQVQTAKLLSGVQLITTRLPNGQMAFILPTNLMTETQQTHQPQQQPQPQPRQQSQQSYIPIPVFAPTSTSITPLSSTVSGQQGVMALLPQVSKNSVTSTTSMAFMPHLFQLPQMTGMNSPFSHLPLVNAYPSETTTGGTGLSLPVKLPSSITEIKHPVLLPELTKTTTASTPSIQLQAPAKREEHIVVEPVAPIPQPTEEENVWRPWAH